MRIHCLPASRCSGRPASFMWGDLRGEVTALGSGHSECAHPARSDLRHDRHPRHARTLHITLKDVAKQGDSR